MKRHLVSFLVAVLAATMAQDQFAKADNACQPLRRIASTPMQSLSTGVVATPMEIAGHSINLVVETESPFSTMKVSTVSTLGLPREQMGRAYSLAVGDTKLYDYAIANPIKIGNVTGKMQFVVVPDSDVWLEASGFLASDFLMNYDVELDLAHNIFNLYSTDHCAGGVVYWTHEPVARVPMEVDKWGGIRIVAGLEGQKVDATLATGSESSTMVMSEREAMFAAEASQWKLIKITPKDPEWNNSRVTTYKYTFKSLDLDGLVVTNPTVTVEVVQLGPVRPHLSIAMDVLRQLHLYIAYGERNLYATAVAAH